MKSSYYDFDIVTNIKLFYVTQVITTEICEGIHMALHSINTFTRFEQSKQQNQTMRSGLFCMSIRP